MGKRSAAPTNARAVTKEKPHNAATRPARQAARPLLRIADQTAIATLLVAALASMAVYWFTLGGHRGELIEIDRAAPLTAHFEVDLNTAPWSARPSL